MITVRAAAMLMAAAALGGCSSQSEEPQTYSEIETVVKDQWYALATNWNAMNPEQMFAACDYYNDSDFRFWQINAESVRDDYKAGDLDPKVYTEFYNQACAKLTR